MPFPTDPNEYIFKMPFASCIHPHLKPNETLSILHDINASLEPSRRLPFEILVLIKNKVHKPNTVWEDIRSTWTAAPINEDAAKVEEVWDAGFHHMQELLPKVVLDPNTMKYHTVENLLPDLDYTHPQYKAQARNISHQMSSADILYRLRCLFPEMYIWSSNRYNGVWEANIRHEQTRFRLSFWERRGDTTLYNPYRAGGMRPRVPGYDEKLEVFSEDCVKLLNALIETVDTDGETQLAFFHPTATASRPSNEMRYIAVPIERVRDRISLDEIDERPFKFWFPVEVSAADLSPLSSFHSLLADLKYDIKTRKIDPVNGATPLTEVISSALLYYRLLCKYPGRDQGNATIPSGRLGSPITNSIWQMKCRHQDNHNALILFMDNRGLFDIRVNEDAMEVMDDVVSLINSLCSDNCTHPYNGLVAGCVA